MQNQVLLIFWFEKLEFIRFKKFAQRGARTHDPEIKSLVLYRIYIYITIISILYTISMQLISAIK